MRPLNTSRFAKPFDYDELQETRNRVNYVFDPPRTCDVIA